MSLGRKQNDPNLTQPTPERRPVVTPSPKPAASKGQVYTNKAGQFVIHEVGLELVKSFEGMFHHAYQDSVGVWTIGWGRIKYDDGTAVKAGDSCTQEQADEWLIEDLEKDGAQYVRRTFGDACNPDQFSALVSFTFNRGAGRLADLVAHAGKNLTAVGNELLHYNWALSHGVHKYLLGLDRRRYAERCLYFGGDWHAFDTLAKFEAFKARGEA